MGRNHQPAGLPHLLAKLRKGGDAFYILDVSKNKDIPLIRGDLVALTNGNATLAGKSLHVPGGPAMLVLGQTDRFQPGAPRFHEKFLRVDEAAGRARPGVNVEINPHDRFPSFFPPAFGGKAGKTFEHILVGW
jgi:hypothetical protein